MTQQNMFMVQLSNYIQTIVRYNTDDGDVFKVGNRYIPASAIPNPCQRTPILTI